MSRRPFDTNYGKTSRTDRFAQMSYQEKLIEQKKLEIQAKMEAKKINEKNVESKDTQLDTNPKMDVNTSTDDKKETAEKTNQSSLNSSGMNMFSNDGSFLDQFKQLKQKKIESKFKAFNKYRNKEMEKERENTNDKSDKSRWAPPRSVSPPMETNRLKKFSTERFFVNLDHQKITINTSFFNTNNYSHNIKIGNQPVNNLEASQLPFVLNDEKPAATVVTSNNESSISRLPSNNNNELHLAVSNSLPQSILPQPMDHSANVTASTPFIEEIITSLPTSVPPSLLQPPPLLNQTTLVATPNTCSALNTSQQPQQIIQAPPQVLMNMLPQQMQSVASQQTQNVSVTAPAGLLTSVTLAPPAITPQNINVTANINIKPPVLSSVEVNLTSIPPPNPIQVQNIPPPEPLNTLNIPPPVPIQVQNIPTPAQLRLTEIPNPKPLDLLTIPSPESDTLSLSNAEFIKNVPPPNKNVPPPNLADVSNTVAAVLPPTVISTTTYIPTESHHGIFIHHISDQTVEVNNPITCLQDTGTSVSSLGITLSDPPPPSSSSNVEQPMRTPSIPSLMSQTVLPPPRMVISHPLIQVPPPGDFSQPHSNFLTQMPPSLPAQQQQQQQPNQLPNMTVPPPNVTNSSNSNSVGGLLDNTGFKGQLTGGGAEYEAMLSLARMVADCGPSVEDVVRQKKNQDPNLWFLFHRESPTYRQYVSLVEQFRKEKGQLVTGSNSTIKENDNKTSIKEKQIISEKYEPEMVLEDDELLQNSNTDTMHHKRQQQEVNDVIENSDVDAGNSNNVENTKQRKKKSRWGDKDTKIALNSSQIQDISISSDILQGSQQKTTRTDPGLLQYTIQSYGTVALSEEDWKKAEDNYKIHLLYQDMLKKREEVKRLNAQGQNKYEYDSDEDVDGGTWEHKLREKEMQATEKWATELTRHAEGKHHIGDFLPPEELKRFLNKTEAFREGRQPNFSDYKEFKIKEDNIGFKMLRKLGWTEGQGLGHNSTGIVEPINKGAPRENTQGLGLNSTNDMTEEEDVYQSYRKRMMLAYRFRPNPLNNPRRPYY